MNQHFMNEVVEPFRQAVREHALYSDLIGLSEEAIERVLKQNNDNTGEFRVRIDRETYGMEAWRIWEVIPDDQPIEDVGSQKSFEAAQEIDPEAQIGGDVSMECEPLNLYLDSNVQTFTKEFNYCLRRAVENGKIFDDYLLQCEGLVEGTVKWFDSASENHVIMVQGVKCILPDKDVIPGENLNPGNQIRCLIREIKEDPDNGRKVILTRNGIKFVEMLICRVVPGINNGEIEVVNVVRHLGYGGKIAIRSRDPSVDNPVGRCLGKGCSIFQPVSDELRGEKFSLVPWNEDILEYVKRALFPNKKHSEKAIVSAEMSDRTCRIIIREDYLGLAYGESQINLKLARRLTDCKINIIAHNVSDDTEVDGVEAQQKPLIDHCVDEAGIDEMMHEVFPDKDAQLLQIMSGILSPQMAPEAEKIRQAAESISAKCDIKPEAIVVIGNGLGSLAETLVENATTIDYSSVPGFPVPASDSQPGRLIIGTLSGRGVAVLCGRAHTYEGHNSATVVRPLRSLAMLGAKAMLATSFAGALNSEFELPSLMLIKDYIEITDKYPADGPPVPNCGLRIADMEDSNDPQLFAVAREHVKKSSKVPVFEGVYAAVAGPMLVHDDLWRMKKFGADAVGMSTVHEEILAARLAGMKVLGMSALGNYATGLPSLDIDALLEASKRIADSMASVLSGILVELGQRQSLPPSGSASSDTSRLTEQENENE